MAPLTKPLLGKQEGKGSSMNATIINLLKNMVGAGLLNVCIAFKYSSVLGGLFAMAFSAFVSTAGFLMIGFCCSKVNAKSFREVWRASLGTGSEKIVDVVLFFHCLFSCVGYITLIGDFSVCSFSGLFPDSILGTRRDVPILLITAVFIFPLSQLKSLDPLKFTSALGLGITAMACLYVFCEAFATAEEHDAIDNLVDNWWYLKFDIFKTIALFNGSFSAHYNAPTYYAELKDKSFKRFAQAALYSFAIATALFTVFGVVGFARFGDDIMGNILKGYEADDVFVQLSWVAMMTSTIFVFPHAFQRMRASWNELLDKPPGWAFQSTTIGLLALCVWMGTAFEDIAVIKLFKGATLGTSLMFIFPAIFYISISNQEAQMPDPEGKRKGEPVALLQVLCCIMIVCGVGQGALAIASHFRWI
eukprot:CAMPEP_0195062304 /NCGR_PEP_ID=MMETSP0448-20130528/8958_1 /TAXON_ID=66468 /ORGANISM="Heterocapsa triquestra, Strain CCMP 448" /LENGTH=417 /DNA_ID=CAMNT_0040092971 /DNA_START=77 /DNA_END=1330 /DNA_ORIENTATION=+